MSQEKKMKTVSICKAEPIGADVPNVELRVQDPMPTFSIALGRDVEREAFFDQQAATLLDALSPSLPGGTMDALLVRLLRRRIDLLSIPWPAEQK